MSTENQPAASPRVAIVTGGSGGIGRAAALRLAAANMSVIVHYAGNEQRASDVVDAITDAGGSASTFGADVADETQVAAMFEETQRLYGGSTS